MLALLHFFYLIFSFTSDNEMKLFFLIRVFIVVHRRLLFATLGRLVGILQTLTSKLHAYYENRYKNRRAIFISINSYVYIYRIMPL